MTTEVQIRADLQSPTLAEAKQHLRVTHNEDDTYIQSLINAATAEREDSTGIALRQIAAIYTGTTPSNFLPVFLPYRPIASVTAVTVNGQPVGYTLQGNKVFPTSAWQAGTVKITFTATPNGVVQSTDSIAILHRVAYLYVNRGDENDRG